MRLDRRVILLTVLAALLYLAIEAAVDKWFHPETASGYRWFLGATTHDTVLRLVGLVAILGIGGAFSAVVARSRRATEELRTSRADCQQLYNNAQVGLGRTRISDGKFLECNDRMARLLGYDGREHMLREGNAGRHHVDPGDMERLMAQLRAKGEVIGFDGRARCLDGSVKWLRYSTRIYPDQGYMEGVAVDVTEEKRALEAVKASEREMAGILNSLSEHVVYHDPDMTIRWANRAAGESVRLAPEALVGECCWQMWARRETPCDGCPVRRALRTGRPEEGEMTTPDGRCWLVHGDPVRDENGRIIGVVEITTEISDRKRADEALQRERDFANNLVETAQAVIVVLDQDGRIVRFNRFASELTGYAEREVLGKDWFETFLPAGERKRIQGVFEEVVAGQERWGVENPILTKDAREPLVRWFNSLLRDASGKVVGVLAVGHDITEIRQKELQLRQAAKMEAVGRLAAGMAHDFNNMLAIVQGYADMLSRSLGSEHEAYEDVEKIRMASRRAAALTKRLLALGRRQVSQPRALQLNETIADMGSILRQTMGENVELEMQQAEDLWPVKADSTQMEEVILNLVLNAREAMPSGGKIVLGTANVTLERDFVRTRPDLEAGDFVVLAISDTGSGISEADRAHIFEPFFTTKQDAGGTGLGLSVCYGIVAQSGGHIDVHSTPGEGATFRVYLPRAAEAVAEPPPPAKREPRQFPRGSETVLVAEDEQDVRRLIVRVLRECGYTVLETGNARESLPLGEHYEGDIDLLISDVVMPGMSGKDLADRLRRIRPRMQVLYISGYAEEALAPRGVLTERVNFLPKPFAPWQVAETVRRVLDARRTHPGPPKR